MALMYWKILGVRLFGGDKSEVLKLANKGVENRPYWIATVNPEFVMRASKDKDFFEILKKTDLNVVDGVGLLWARAILEKSQITNYKLQNKIARAGFGLVEGLKVLGGAYDKRVVRGSELMVDLVKQSKRTFLLGGLGEVAEKTGEYLKQITNHKLQITSSSGEPDFSNQEVLEKIGKYKPDLLLVAYGMVKQEKWIEANFEQLKEAGVKVVMGVGRSFDYYGGKLRQPPKIWRKMGLEWLYSLIQEPKRWKRQLELVRFVGRVLWM